MKILVTGTAGFIGFHLAKRLLEDGHEVVGLDNINSYYDVRLKYARLRETGIREESIEYGKETGSDTYPGYRFVKLDLTDGERLDVLLGRERFDVVVNLAAQAGVRYSLENPRVYVDSNVVGFLNVLEGCRYHGLRHLVYASSSSVYGLNANVPFKEDSGIAHPVSLYAATKKGNELMAHVYSHLFGVPTTGLRFFTVYGPWGRPDMSPHLFTGAILEGRPIKVFNHGDMLRDFTYIDDIIEGVVRVIHHVPEPDGTWRAEEPNPASSCAPYRVYNIGNSSPVRLMDFIEALEKACGREAVKEYLPMQPGDVYQTNADVTRLERDMGYKPSMPLEEGVRRFVEWCVNYYERECCG